jgi:hypothetical protein
MRCSLLMVPMRMSLPWMLQTLGMMCWVSSPRNETVTYQKFWPILSRKDVKFKGYDE